MILIERRCASCGVIDHETAGAPTPSRPSTWSRATFGSFPLSYPKFASGVRPPTEQRWFAAVDDLVARSPGSQSLTRSIAWDMVRTGHALASLRTDRPPTVLARSEEG